MDSGSDEDASADEDVSVALEHLLQLRRPSASAGSSGDDGSEDLMAVAKATGKELYSGLPPVQRIERINKMVSCFSAQLGKRYCFFCQ